MIANVALVILCILLIVILLYIRIRILKPFTRLREVPYELSKGNLVTPMQENKGFFFGRFIWGINILREKMEQQKSEEMKMKKDQKTLLLSISHDIKTPLSAIKLYAQSITKGLYEDFLNLTVVEGEFYLSELVKAIDDYYDEKLALLHTEFTIQEYSDGIVKGDKDRTIEVLQNIMENAIKYGDGHSITIGFTQEEGYRLLTIENSGISLTENELPHIFDSFWRGSNTQGKPGSGLGLYICKQLMNQMGGEIFADQNNGNVRVTIVLPIA